MQYNIFTFEFFFKEFVMTYWKKGGCCKKEDNDNFSEIEIYQYMHFERDLWLRVDVNIIDL